MRVLDRVRRFSSDSSEMLRRGADTVGTVERCLACEADTVGTVERCLACEAKAVGNDRVLNQCLT